MAPPRHRRRTPRSQPSLADARSGLVVGAFRIEEERAAAQAGRRFLARELKGEGQVLLRFAPESIASDPAAIQRFLDTARRRAALSHPSLERVVACGDLAGWPWVALEIVDGGALAEELAEGRRLAAPRAVALLVDVAAALAAAHAAGLAHGSLSPASLLVDRRDRVKVANLGLDAGPSASPARDLVALGATFYELLCGTRPQLEPDRQELPLRARDPRVPRDLAAIVERCLGWGPRGGYGDCAALAADLATVGARFAPRAAPPPASEPTVAALADPEETQRIVSRLAALAALLVAVMVAMVAARPAIAPRPAPPPPLAESESRPLRARLLPRLSLGAGESQAGAESASAEGETAPIAPEEAATRDPGEATIASLDRLLAAVLEYTAAYGTAPPSLETLVVAGEASAEDLLDGWQRPISYRIDPGRVTVSSSGPDGVAGTSDDLAVDRGMPTPVVLPRRFS
ncbi:MAG: protein kinase [Thermoanaerobaculia bacterium]